MPMHRIKELAETRLMGYEIAPAAGAGDRES
jgi:hypothetical protein